MQIYLSKSSTVMVVVGRILKVTPMPPDAIPLIMLS